MRGRGKWTVILAALLASPFFIALSAAAQQVAVIPTRVIYPGETVAPDALKEITLRQAPRATTAIVRQSTEIEGKVARRTLLPGRLIPVGSVREPYLVEAGSPVTVEFVEGALSISLVAVPLQSGAMGDMIRMRNMESGAIFSGVVLADGTVRIGAS